MVRCPAVIGPGGPNRADFVDAGGAFRAHNSPRRGSPDNRLENGLLWRRRAGNAAQHRDCTDPGAGDGAGRAAFCRLEQVPQRVRDPGQPDDRPAGPHRRSDRRPAAADPVAEPVAHRHRARPGEAGSLRARRLSIEFSLGSLVRGEFKATDVILEGAEIAIALDRNGRLEWPAPSVGFDPEAISIERLDIRDSRVLLADAASGYGMVLDKLEFKGELRTLVWSGQRAGIVLRRRPALSLSRRGESGRRRTRPRVRLNIDPIDRPLTDGCRRVPVGRERRAALCRQRDGARPLTRRRRIAGARSLEPWRLTGKIDGNSTRAVVEQIEFQYGPDERPIRMRGDALVNFGASPRVHRRAVVAADRSRPDPGAAGAAASPPARRHQGLRRLVRGFAAPADPGFARRQRRKPHARRRDACSVSAAISRARANGWNIEKLELRAPGLSQLAMSGRLGVADGISFSGRTRLASKDPRTLIAWLTDPPRGSDHGRGEPQRRWRLQAEHATRSRSIASRPSSIACRSKGGLPIRGATSQRPPRIEAGGELARYRSRPRPRPAAGACSTERDVRDAA